jgi:hypothetical protein
MSYNDYLTGELGALSDDRSTIEWDNGDRLRWLGNALIGRGAEFSREGVRSRAKTKQEENVNKKLAGDRRKVTDLLAGTGIDTANLTLGGNRTVEDLNAEMSSLLTAGQAAQQYAAMPGGKLSDIKPGSTLSTITQLGQELAESNKQADETKAEDKETALWKRTTDRQDDLTKRQNERQDKITERQNIREDRRDARQALQLAQQRKDTLELRRDNMNLEYARLAQADKYKAQDRKDKAIMMLLQGLGNLGAGFTI